MNFGDYPKGYVNVFLQYHLWLSGDFEAEKGRDRRFENLSLSEDVDGRLLYGFEPSLTHVGWLYVHIGEDIEVVTVVGAKYA